jgi:hypothetical protein
MLCLGQLIFLSFSLTRLYEELMVTHNDYKVNIKPNNQLLVQLVYFM